MESEQTEVDVDVEVTEEVDNEEGEKYTGGPVPEVSPTEDNES